MLLKLMKEQEQEQEVDITKLTVVSDSYQFDPDS